MLAYKPQTAETQKIINNLNKAYNRKENLFQRLLKRFDITAEDFFLMLISSTIFSLIIVFLV